MSELLSTVALNHAERKRLSDLEAVIQRGFKTFVEVGDALLEIRDSHLYKESHRAFDDYCRERWGMERTYAHRMIDAARVAELLLPIGNTPANEAQARELAPLLTEPNTLREAWDEIVELHPAPTAANVREVVQRKMGVHYSSKTDEWSTPQELFELLNQEFLFDLDVCATADNAKCERFYSREDDGLSQTWAGSCWMNPPYGDEIGEWVKKAHEWSKQGAIVVCLVPARTDTAWWHDYTNDAEVRLLRGRLKFGGGTTGAPFPSAVVIFSSDYEPKIVNWSWRD